LAQLYLDSLGDVADDMVCFCTNRWSHPLTVSVSDHRSVHQHWAGSTSNPQYPTPVIWWVARGTGGFTATMANYWVAWHMGARAPAKGLLWDSRALLGKTERKNKRGTVSFDWQFIMNGLWGDAIGYYGGIHYGYGLTMAPGSYEGGYLE